jgi:hypothetical protein
MISHFGIGPGADPLPFGYAAQKRARAMLRLKQVE